MAITIHPNNANTPELAPVDRQFVDLIQNKITMYGQIPYTVPEKLIVETIKSSARLFYKYYDKAWKSSFFYISKADLLEYSGSNSFVNLCVAVDPRIRIIKKIYEMSSNTMGDDMFMDMNQYATDNRAIGGNASQNSFINKNLYIIEAAVRMVEKRAYDAVFGSGVPFNFSPNTSELILRAEPKTNIVLDVKMDNDINSLYNDSFFERHVLANVKRELKRLIGGHTFPLPGDVTINGDEICNNLEDVEKVEDILKASGGVGDIIMKRRG